MTIALKVLTDEIKAGLREIYANRLRGVYLYGSYARGEQDAESDVDVLVVLDDFTHYASGVERTGVLASHLSLAHGLSISTVFLREAEWLRGQTPFLANVREEAILA